MLALSQTTGYAILALSCLESTRGTWVLSQVIADCTGVPKAYLSKVLHSLGRAGLVTTKRGYRGGFQLARPADAISLLDIVRALQDERWFSQCLLGLEGCSDERNCPTHEFWKDERARIEGELRRLTLRDVAELERGQGKRMTRCHCDTETRNRCGT